MPKLRILSGKEVGKILASYGFVEVRRRGSHIVMQKKLVEQRSRRPCPIIRRSDPGHCAPLFGNRAYLDHFLKNQNDGRFPMFVISKEHSD